MPPLSFQTNQFLCANFLSLKKHVTNRKDQNRRTDQTGQLGPDDQDTLTQW